MHHVPIYLAVSYHFLCWRNLCQSGRRRNSKFLFKCIVCLFLQVILISFWLWLEPILHGIALLLQLAHVSTGDPGSLESVLTPSLTPRLSYSKWCSVPWFPRLHHWHCLAAWCCLLGCSKPAPAMMTSEPWSGFLTAYWIKWEANWRNSKAFEWKMCSHDPKICVLWMTANTSFSEHQPTQERLPATSHKMVHVHMVFWSKQCLQKCCLPLEWFPWPLVPSGWTWTGLKTSFCTAQKVLF